jgi:tRNA A37 threonylcarbamoyltransferase TsaD
MTIIGETTDDAVGEAFDKSAKILVPIPVVLRLDVMPNWENPEDLHPPNRTRQAKHQPYFVQSPEGIPVYIETYQ